MPKKGIGGWPAYFWGATNESTLDKLGDVRGCLAHVSADFRSPALIEERLRVGMRVSRLGTKSFEAEYRVEEAEKGRLIAEGRSVMVMFDYQKRATFALPEDLREKVRALEQRPSL